MLIPIINPKPRPTEKTWLSSNYTSGTTLNVKSSLGFADDYFALVGEPFQERTELTALTATPPSTTTLTVTALDFAHAKDEPVYRMVYDQAVIHRSTDGGENFSSLATVDLNYEKYVTLYDDTTGQSNYQYKIQYKNSITDAVSAYSDAQSGTGWPRNAVGRLVRNIRTKIGDKDGKRVEDWEILEELQNAADDVAEKLPNPFWLRRDTPKTTTADIARYPLPTNYKAMKKLYYTYNPNDATERKYPLGYAPEWEFDRLTEDQTAASDDNLSRWTELPGDDDYPNGYFAVYPTPASSDKEFILRHYINETGFDSYGDLVLCPTPQTYEYYVISKLHPNDKVRQEYEIRYANAIDGLRKRERRNYEPKEMRTWGGRNPKRRLYGRGRAVKTDSDKELYF